MSIDRLGPVLDQASRPREDAKIITWSPESIQVLREVPKIGEKFDAFFKELEDSNVDDEKLRDFAERFQEILQLLEKTIGELSLSISAAAMAGEFAELLGDSDVPDMERRLTGLGEAKKELLAAKDQIQEILAIREHHRTREAREKEEQERFVLGLSRSGFDGGELFGIIESIQPEKTAIFLDKIAAADKSRWDRVTSNVKNQNTEKKAEIQKQRDAIETNCIALVNRGETTVMNRKGEPVVLKTLMDSIALSLGIDGKLTPISDSQIPLVVKLKEAGTYEQAIDHVRGLYQGALDAFRAKEDLLLRELEAAAEKTKQEAMKVVMLKELKTQDVTLLLEDSSIPRDVVAQKIAENISNPKNGSKRWPPQNEGAPSINMREVAFLPKSVLDRLVARMSYESIAGEIAKKDTEKSTIFWSESFGERLAQMKARHKELSTRQAYEETDPPSGWVGRETPESERKRNLLDDPKSLSGKLFAQYKKADTAYFAFGNAGSDKERTTRIDRNRVFEAEIRGIFDRYRISNTLAGRSADINKGENMSRGFSSVGDSLFLNGNYVFLTDAQRERGERVSPLFGRSAMSDRRNRREFTPEQEDAHQKSEFLEIQGQIAEFARNFDRQLPEESQKSKQENAAREKLAEVARKIETDFAGLEAELAPFKAEAATLAQEVSAMQKKMQEMHQRHFSVEELTALKDENTRIMALVKDFDTRATALRKKALDWGFRGYTGDPTQDTARGIASSVGKDFIEQERAVWDITVAKALMDSNSPRFQGDSIGENLDYQLRQVQEETERQVTARKEVLRTQAEQIQREQAERERIIRGQVEKAEGLYREKSKQALSLEKTIEYNKQIIVEASDVIAKINEAFEKNKDVSFHLLRRKQNIFYYDDTEKKIKPQTDATSDDYKWRTDDMTTLKAKKEKEVADARVRIAGFKENIRVLSNDIHDPYQDAERGLANMSLDEDAIAIKLAEAARLRDVFISRTQEILS